MGVTGPGNKGDNYLNFYLNNLNKSGKTEKLEDAATLERPQEIKKPEKEYGDDLLTANYYEGMGVKFTSKAERQEKLRQEQLAELDGIIDYGLDLDGVKEPSGVQQKLFTAYATNGMWGTAARMYGDLSGETAGGFVEYLDKISA